MTTDPFNMLSAEQRDAIRSALSASFGAAPLDTVTPLAGGAMSAADGATSGAGASEPGESVSVDEAAVSAVRRGAACQALQPKKAAPSTQQTPMHVASTLIREGFFQVPRMLRGTSNS